MGEPLRIVQVVNVRWFNATAWYGLHLSRLLSAAGHDVKVLCLPETACFAKARDMGLEPVPLDVNRHTPAVFLKSLREIRGLLRDFSPHIVNCHRGEGMVLWGAFKSFFPFALVRTRGDQRPPKNNMPNRYLYGHMAEAVIATNSRTAEQCRVSLRVPGEKLYLIPGGVDTSRFFPDPDGRRQIRERLGYAEQDIVVGLLGRFDPVKGHKELLEVFSRVRFAQGQSPTGWRGRMRLLLAGFPTSASDTFVERLVHEHNLRDCTVITGKVRDITSYINAMDLGVVASQGSEAIARAALEIMACGVPLISTDVGVMPDLLEPEAMAPVHSTTALGALLESALASRAWREGLRERQRRRMQSFSHQRFLEQSLAAYHEALARRG